MSYKLKSSMYFTSLIVAVVMYYSIDNSNRTQEIKIAQNTIENVSTNETLN